jgi:hypothetical protein
MDGEEVLPSHIAHADAPARPFAIRLDSEIKSHQFGELPGIFRRFKKATLVVVSLALLAHNVEKVSLHSLHPTLKRFFTSLLKGTASYFPESS